MMTFQSRQFHTGSFLPAFAAPQRREAYPGMFSIFIPGTGKGCKN